jgi:hypothetical protein
MLLLFRLGVIVVDEEQRFGVNQKEKLKSLKVMAFYLCHVRFFFKQQLRYFLMMACIDSQEDTGTHCQIFGFSAKNLAPRKSFKPRRKASNSEGKTCRPAGPVCTSDLQCANMRNTVKFQGL